MLMTLRARAVFKNIGRIFLLFLLLLIFVVSFLVGVCWVVFKGPSPAARDLLVVSAMETSAAKFVPRIFFSEEEIQEIIERNSVLPTYTVTDPSSGEESPGGGENVQNPETPAEPLDLSATELVEVSGSTYKGKMLIVNDPSRVYVATPGAFNLPSGGMRVEEMCKRDDALAGVNGGGFLDENGVGDGGCPIGLVISNGMVALSGALIAQYQSFADVQMGTGSIVIGLASLIIGEVLFGTRTFKRTLVSVSLGAIIYRIIIALVLKAGMDANDLKLFTAVTVAICLSMPMIKPAVAGFFHPGSKKAEGGN